MTRIREEEECAAKVMAAFLIVAALLLLRFPFIYSNSGVRHVPHLYSTPPVVFRKNVQ